MATAYASPTVRRARRLLPGTHALRVILALAVAAATLVSLWSWPRDADPADLRQALAAGEVHDVVIGRAETVGVPWRVEADLLAGQVVWQDDRWRTRTTYLDFEVAELLGVRQDAAGTTVTQATRPEGRPFDHDIGDPLRGVAVLSSLLVLILLVRGPQPRWATKWAWFWLGATPLGLGILAWLALEVPWSRRAHRLPEPQPGAREERLTGGIAFGLFLIASSVLTQLVSAGWVPWPTG